MTKYLFVMLEIYKEAGAELSMRDLIFLLIQNKENVSLIAYKLPLIFEKSDIEFYKIKKKSPLFFTYLSLFFSILRIKCDIVITKSLGFGVFPIWIASKISRKKFIFCLSSDFDIEKQKSIKMKIGQFASLRADLIFYQKYEQKGVLENVWKKEKISFLGRVIL